MIFNWIKQHRCDYPVRLMCEVLNVSDSGFYDYSHRQPGLRVTIKASVNTSLDKDDVFYFGNAPGETGNSAIDTYVDAADEILARNNVRHFLDPATIDSPHDHNRDKKVDATDEIISRNNSTNLISALRLLAP